MRLPNLALCAGLLLCAAPLAAQPLPADLTLTTLNPGQNLPGVVGVRHAGDGSDRLFAIVRTGQIRIFDANRSLQATPFLSFQANPPPLGFTQVGGTSGDERGLLGLAFHPLYASNGKFYVYYIDGNGDTAITEYTRSTTNPDVADPASARVILRIWQPASNHNGGDIHFGADGYLYVGMGDGGGQNDTTCNAGQSLSTTTMSCSINTNDPFRTAVSGQPTGNIESRALLGKMLRIDVDGTDAPTGADRCGIDPANARYGIPPDNPFAGDGGGDANACDEIYHYGLRNPFRFSFDRDTHDLIIADVGQNTYEEVNLVGPAGGLNFGWRVCEGFFARGSTSTDCPLAGATDPILAYDHDTGGISITGGFRYRGPYAALQGVYFYADAYFSKIFYARENAGSWTGATWLENQGTVVGFGEDEAGHLYLTTLAGQVKRFTLPEPPAALTLVQSVTGMPPGPGAIATVQVTVTNDGTQLIDSIAANGTLQGGAQQPATCQATSLPAGASTTCSLAHPVSQAQFDANAALVHTIVVTALLPDDTVVTAEDDTLSVPLAPADSEIALGLSSTSTGPVGVGEPIAVRAQVTNLGNVTQSGIVMTNARGEVATCDVTTIAPPDVAICTFPAYTITQADVDAGSILETITVTSSGARGGPVSQTHPIRLSTQLAAPAVVATLAVTALTDADGDGLVEPGDTVRIAAAAQNTGNVTLTAVTLGASPGGTAACAASLAPQDAAAGCAPIDYVVQAADIVDGAFRVEAVVGGMPPQQLPRIESEPVQQSLPGELVILPEIFADGFEAADLAPR